MSRAGGDKERALAELELRGSSRSLGEPWRQGWRHVRHTGAGEDDRQALSSTGPPKSRLTPKLAPGSVHAKLPGFDSTPGMAA